MVAVVVDLILEVEEVGDKLDEPLLIQLHAYLGIRI